MQYQYPEMTFISFLCQTYILFKMTYIHRENLGKLQAMSKLVFVDLVTSLLVWPCSLEVRYLLWAVHSKKMQVAWVRFPARPG
jgi:hypothetical protein